MIDSISVSIFSVCLSMFIFCGLIYILAKGVHKQNIHHVYLGSMGSTIVSGIYNILNHTSWNSGVMIVSGIIIPLLMLCGGLILSIKNYKQDRRID